MKIIIVAPYFYPRIGGLENYALGVATHLHKNGHEIVVVTSNHSSRKRTEEIVEGMRVIRLATLLNLSNTPVHPLWFFQIKAIFKQEKPDAIVAHTPVPFIADMAARAAGRIPFVLTYHNDLAKDNKILRAILSVYWHVMGKGTMHRAGRIIATSRFYAETSPYLQPFSAKTAIVPPGVDTSRFNTKVDASAVKQRFSDKQIVLFVSSLSKTHAHKGLDILIRAVANLRRDNPKIHLVVVGQGDNAPHYQAVTKEQGIEADVTFTGFVSDNELPGYYAAADVFILPSTNQAEGFGMVLAEASACGTPVIGTNVGGIPAAMAMVGSKNLAEPNETSITAMLKTVLASGKRTTVTQAPHSWTAAAEMTKTAVDAARRPRVALIHNVIAPYRLAMFEQLSATTNLEVLFTQATIKDRKWQNNLEHQNFSSQLLRSFSIGPIAFNPGGFRTLWQSRFDVLITNTDPDTAPLSLTGLIIAKLRRRPIIVWSEVTNEVIQSLPILAYATSEPLLTISRFVSWCVMLYRKIFFRSATSFLAFSNEAKKFLLRHGAKESHILRTYEIVPTELLPPAKVKPSRGGKSFLFVGYLSRHKNVSMLIDAFAGVTDPAAKLTIVGTGEEEASLRARAAGDKRIYFAGYADSETKANLYNSHDVLILPSTRDCWGLVVNEAMHYGLAVIVSDAAVACELVDSSTGIVTPSGNTKELTAAINRLLTEKTTLQNMQRHNAKQTQVSDTAMAVKPFDEAIHKAVAR